MKRVITALLLAPAVLYVVLWGHEWVFFGVVGLVAALCYREYCEVAAGYGVSVSRIFGLVAGLLVLAITPEAGLLLTVITLFALCLALATQDLRQSLPQASFLVLGVLYIFGAWKCAILLRVNSPYWLLYVLALNWIGDTFAYYVGRWIGRHKLAPRISPGKSWEGAAASMASSLLFGVPFLGYFFPSIPAWVAVALTMGVNITGQIGDLAESALKRGAGIKDSGSMLPGHGGLLDRVDGTLFSLPAVYLFLLRWH